MRAALFAQGKITTERFDAKGYTADYLLNVLDKSNIYPKLKPKWGKKHITGNVYAITLTASPTKVLDAHFTSGEKGSWNKELNKKLKANSVYKVDDYIYKTDDLGRVNKVEAKLIYKEKGRNEYQQKKSISIKDGVKGQDDGGHLIAQIFNGPGEQINYVPQKSTLNRGDWKAMENKWAKALKEKKEVYIEINNIFEGESKRPVAQEVKYKIGKDNYKEFFEN